MIPVPARKVTSVWVSNRRRSILIDMKAGQTSLVRFGEMNNCHNSAGGMLDMKNPTVLAKGTN